MSSHLLTDVPGVCDTTILTKVAEHLRDLLFRRYDSEWVRVADWIPDE